MDSVHEKSLKLLEEFVDSNEGKKYFENLKHKKELKEDRYIRFKKYLETHDFDRLMYRLILEHGEDYCRKCYDNGCMPYPNNKLEFVIDYVFNNTESITIDEIDTVFTNETHEFNGYYFQMVWGQGVVTYIYNKEDMRLLLQV